MKYTRYNVRRPRRRNNNFVIILAATLLLAFLTGTIIFKLFFKDSNLGSKFQEIKDKNIIDVLNKDDDTEKDNLNKENLGSESQEIIIESKNKEESAPNTTESVNKNIILHKETMKFYAIQCGVFKNEENVEKLKKDLSIYGNPFSIEEADFSRVILGIYNEDNIETIIQKLKEDGLETNKIIFELKLNDLCHKEICEIAAANVKVLTKLSEKGVASVETSELKKWINSLEKVDNDSENYKQLEGIKKYTNSLPEKLTREIVSEKNIYIYNYLKELSIR